MTDNKHTNKPSNKSTILISVLISVAATILIFGAGGYVAYNKYIKVEFAKKLITKNIYNSFKGKDIPKIINDKLKDLVETGNLKESATEMLEQYTGGDVEIEDIIYIDDEGAVINNIKISRGDDKFFVKTANITLSEGVVLNGIVRTGKKDADRIEINRAHIDIGDITLDKVRINPVAEITVENPRLIVEKIVIEYNLLELLRGKFVVKGVTAQTPELFSARRVNGIWLIMDTFKGLLDKCEAPEYCDMLKNGLAITNGSFHFIDKDYFPEGEIYVAGIDMTVKPFAGSLRNLQIEGAANDPVFGDFTMTGALDLSGPILNIKVAADDMNVSKNIFMKMPVVGNSIWERYKPAGKLGLKGAFEFDNSKGGRKIDRAINIVFKDMEVTYHKWPFTVSRGTGELALLNNMINIKNAEGFVFDAGQEGVNVNLDVVMELGKQPKTIKLKAYDIKLTDALANKLPDMCRNLWPKFSPQGMGDLDVLYKVVEKGGDVKKDYVVTVDCKDWRVNYKEFPVPTQNINGRIVVGSNVEGGMIGDAPGRVQLLGLKGYFFDGKKMCPLNFNGEFAIGNPKSAFTINIPNLNITDELLENLPEEHKTALKQFKLNGQAGLNIIYDRKDDDSEPDLTLALDCKGCRLEDSRFPVPLHGVLGRVNMEGNHISATNIIGKCYGGLVEGSINVDLGGDNSHYKGDFFFSEMKMEELFRDVFKTDQDWLGILSGKIKFNRGGANIKGFDAAGKITLKDGNIADVPVALSVINIMNLGLPTKVVFDSGYLDFHIKDNMIIIDEAKAFSSSIELSAKGRVTFDGRLDIMVIVGFSHDILKNIPVFGKLFDFVVGGVRKRLTKVHVGGTISKPKSKLAMLQSNRKTIVNELDLITTDHDHGKNGSNGSNGSNGNKMKGKR